MNSVSTGENGLVAFEAFACAKDKTEITTEKWMSVNTQVVSQVLQLDFRPRFQHTQAWPFYRQKWQLVFYSNAAETLVAVREFQPDVLLLDVRLPDRSGLDVCRDLKAKGGGPRVLFLTSLADNALVLAAMQAGGDGYLLKDNEPREIAAALHKVMHDGVIFDPVAARHGGLAQDLNASTSDKLLKALSPQELRVLEAVAAGQTNKEVASSLGLQTKTVRNYLDRVFDKLGVNTRTQAALLYDRHFRGAE